ncbi:MAG: AAA family ATPase, partial [Myxococcota bacterium]
MDIDQLVREFQFAGLSRRRQLAQAAVRDATEADLIRIIHLLVHPSELVRLGAIEILEVAQFRPALPVLVDVTKKRQNDERIFAARAIAAMASPGDIDTLEAVAQSWLRSDDPYLPLHGQIALQRMGLAAPPIPTRAKPRQSSTAAAIRDLAELLEDIEQMSQEQDNIATGDNNGSPGGKRSSDRSGDDDEYSTLDAIDPDSDDSDEFPFDEKTPLWVEDPTEEKLRAELEKLPLSSDAREVVWPELERMAFLTREHPEYEKNHRFLKLVTKLPWGKRVQPVPLSPAVAAERMDATHTGLAEAKRTILKYLAVETLRETPCPRVLCFVGPPGVGKTSLAKSIADVLQRPFCQLSMGGVDDEVAIRGFERTYLFSSP